MKRILPQPTKKNPYAQVDFIFHLIADTKTNKSTKYNYLTALSFYKKFLQQTYNYNKEFENEGLFYLEKHWDKFALMNVKKHLDVTNIKGQPSYLSSHSVVSIFSAIRTVMKEAIVLGYTSFDNLFGISVGTSERETDTNIAYSENELKQIERMLKEELKYAYRVFRKEGYKKTNVGADPRKQENSWGDIHNMRWYFENELNCVPILGTKENKQEHKTYVEYAPMKYFKHLGRLRGIYREWGVAALIDFELIIPLVLQLSMQTGLNAQSILELDIDCFEEKHPISGVPVLKYFKGRSSGEKEMHINLLEDEDKIGLREFRQEQAKLIQNTIKVTLALTEKIRKKAPEHLQQKLFIVQSSSTKQFAEIMQINSRTTSRWCKSMVEKYSLKNDSGEPLNFNLRRFRATKATKLVHEGADLHELQYELGHKNLITTMGYVDKNKLNTTANKETNRVIEKIFANKAWAEINDITYAKTVEEANEHTVFKGFLCDCKNPFNPPADVKKLKDYQEGSACSRVNMCLFCENVLIFKRNLPSLWMYKRQIEAAMEMQSAELPNESYYLKTLDIINALFDVNTSEFTEEDISEAQRLAENLDELIDPVTYRAELEA